MSETSPEPDVDSWEAVETGLGYPTIIPTESEN